MRKRTRTIYILSLLAVLLVGSAVLLRVGYRLGISALAGKRINEDIEQLNSRISIMQQEQKAVNDEISRLDASLSDQSFLNDQISENRDLYSNLSQDIDTANKTIERLDGEIGQKRDTLETLNAIANKEIGSRSTLTPTNTYTCPGDLAEGRYKVTGRGTLLVYAKTNRLRISENLAVLDSNSFTFNLEDGEKIKIDEEMEIVKMN